MSDSKQPDHPTDDELKTQGLPPDYVYYRKFPGYNGYVPPGVTTKVPEHYPRKDGEAEQRLMLVGADPAEARPDVIAVTTPSGIPVLREDGTQFTIEDTREGWTRAMEEVLRRNYVHPVLDKAPEGDDPTQNPCAELIDFRDIQPRGKSLFTVDTPDGPKILGNRNRLMGAKDIAAMMERIGEAVIPRVQHQPADGSTPTPDSDPFGMQALKEEQLKEEFPSKLSQYLGETPPTKREVLIGFGVPPLEPVGDEPVPVVVDMTKKPEQE